MIEFLYRRIINNKWLFLCLLLGALSTTAIISTIPMYSNGIMQEVLVKDLERAHVDTKSSPGKFSVVYEGKGFFNENLESEVQLMDDLAQKQLMQGYDLELVEEVHSLRYDSLVIQREGDPLYNKLMRFAYITHTNNLQEHVEFTYGQMPSSEMKEDVYEAVVSVDAMKKMQLIKDTVYALKVINYLKKEEIEVVRFKIVGVFSVKDKNALYWSDGRYNKFSGNIIFTKEAMAEIFDGKKPIVLKDLENTFFYDYRKIKLEQIEQINQVFQEQTRWIGANYKDLKIQLPIVDILKDYDKRQDQLHLTLWILIIPLMVVMGFYSFMISSLILKNDKNEIAVLKSRGAGRLQIFLLYVVECLVLSGVALIAGPFLGKLICRILGSSNGFLEFISRKVLEVKITLEVYQYAFVSVLVFSIFVLIPAFRASAMSIVQYKQSLLKANKKPIWQRTYLDVIILGFAIYGLYNLKSRRSLLEATGLSGTELQIDPLLFFMSTFFIVGVSLLFLRIYPMVIHIIFKMGIKRWNPVIYFSLVSLSKADRNLQSIILFVILALAFGIMNANQARTINSNIQDQIMYHMGTEVIIEPYNNLRHDNVGAAGGIQIPPVTKKLSTYKQPPFIDYEKIEGVESMTKVLRDDKATLTRGKESVKNLDILGIIPHEFGKTAWFRNDLLPYHINEYLNLMTKVPKAVFLSSTIQKDFDVKMGDEVTINWGDVNQLPFTVYGFIDYFPASEPYGEGGKPNYFAIMNYDYIANKLPAQPYEIWLKREVGILDTVIHQQILDLGLKVEGTQYGMQEIIKKKNDPVLLGTNGVLTMSFMLTMLITATGFIIFWILSIRERTLKYGIFRAIGMPMRHVTAIMICEQLLVSGMAIIMGILLGSLASKIFIPLLETVYSTAQQVPPFQVVGLAQDYYKVLGTTLVMFMISFVVLFRMVKQIKPHQVIKLGEDS